MTDRPSRPVLDAAARSRAVAVARKAAGRGRDRPAAQAPGTRCNQQFRETADFRQMKTIQAALAGLELENPYFRVHDAHAKTRSSIEGRDNPGNVELSEKAYHLFKERRPQLAFMASVQIAGLDKEKVSLLDEALASADEKIENPNVFLVVSVSASAGGSFYGEEISTLPEGYQKKLTQQLVAWYPKLTNLRLISEYVAQKLGVGAQAAVG